MLKEHTAHTLVQMLEGAVGGDGTGKGARIAGARVAGKTGTADATDEGGAEVYYASFVGSILDREPRFVALVGLEVDCLAFAQIMCGGGARGGVRILSPASVEAMTTDQITAEQKAASGSALDPAFWGRFGWGFGCAVVTHPLADGPFGAGWDGGLGTSLWWDAQAQSVGILLTQRSAYPTMNPVYLDSWRAIRG